MYVSNTTLAKRLTNGYYRVIMMTLWLMVLLELFKEFWAFFLSIANKVDKKEGWDLSENNFL